MDQPSIQNSTCAALLESDWSIKELQPLVSLKRGWTPRITEVKALRHLRDENSRLKRLMTDLTLDKHHFGSRPNKAPKRTRQTQCCLQWQSSEQSMSLNEILNRVIKKGRLIQHDEVPSLRPYFVVCRRRECVNQICDIRPPRTRFRQDHL